MVSLQKVQGILVGYILYTVYTDNNPLRYLDTAKLGAVEQRWAAQLPAFNLTLKYRPGSRNGNADALSHQYMEPQLVEASRGGSTVGSIPLCVQSETITLPGCSEVDLALLQKQDPVIGPFLIHWKEGKFLGPKD